MNLNFNWDVNLYEDIRRNDFLMHVSDDEIRKIREIVGISSVNDDNDNNTLNNGKMNLGSYVRLAHAIHSCNMYESPYARHRVNYTLHDVREKCGISDASSINDDISLIKVMKR